MIEITKTEVVGWREAIRGMRNPMNSWDMSDSADASCVWNDVDYGFIIGKNDMELMRRLRNAGTDHRKYLRMIAVYTDINAPLYWWKEYDTYKVGTVANSCSTMHKIHAKEFTMDDFSHEHMEAGAELCMRNTIRYMNSCRESFLETKGKQEWWQMIQLLPSSYNQKRTVMLNYEVLANIYPARQFHKLDEWRFFCDWIETLPNSELITGVFR